MHRILIPPHAVSGSHITIDDPRDIRHLVRVLRVKPGELIECFDGQGRTYGGRITQASGTRLTVVVDEQREAIAPRITFILAQSLIHPARFEWVLQKATELGVARIIPMVTARTISRPASSLGGHRLERWRRIVAESCTQCGRATLPVVEEPQRFADVLKKLDGRYALLPTLEASGAPLEDHLKRIAGISEVLTLIGPEGDFSPDEVSLAIRHGAKTATIGHHPLRSETAAIVTLAILQHAVGAL